MALAALVITGCEGTQSTLAPLGADPAAVALLSWVIFIGGGLILTGVLSFTGYAILAAPERRQWIANNRFIIGGGVIFTVSILTNLLFYGLTLTGTARGSRGDPALRVEITGEQFWWRIIYLNAEGEPAFETANELHVPVGQPVELRLKAADVIHSFWVPRLGGKLDMIPGQVNRLILHPDKPGLARGQCAEYCGEQHANMAFYSIAAPEDEFESWRQNVSAPAQSPETELARTGQTTFLAAGCGACHAVRGTQANGSIGPDLTHVGSRRTIAAGMLETTRKNFARWIAANQHIKPGNRMPPFAALDDEQTEAIAAYLEGLK